MSEEKFKCEHCGYSDNYKPNFGTINGKLLCTPCYIDENNKPLKTNEVNKCPNCKSIYWYSHAGNWICSACGKVIRKINETELEELENEKNNTETIYPN